MLKKVSLKTARLLSGLTQYELAKIIGVSNSTISKWEKGVSEPTVNQAYKICEIVKIPIDFINFLHKNTV